MMKNTRFILILVMVCFLEIDLSISLPGDAQKLCLKKPCKNGGSCLVLGKENKKLDVEAFCRCADGFYGEACEKKMPDLCATQNKCENGARCKVFEYGKEFSTTCECKEGFGYQFCSYKREKSCPTNICLNGGTCHFYKYTADNNYTKSYCECANEFYGENCEKKLQACATNPCKNGGKCIKGDNFQYCKCPNGFIGENCSIKSACATNPCLNGGTCDEFDNGSGWSWTCFCAPGYSGYKCANKSQ